MKEILSFVVGQLVAVGINLVSGFFVPYAEKNKVLVVSLTAALITAGILLNILPEENYFKAVLPVNQEPSLQSTPQVKVPWTLLRRYPATVRKGSKTTVSDNNLTIIFDDISGSEFRFQSPGVPSKEKRLTRVNDKTYYDTVAYSYEIQLIQIQSLGFLGRDGEVAELEVNEWVIDPSYWNSLPSSSPPPLLEDSIEPRKPLIPPRLEFVVSCGLLYFTSLLYMISTLYVAHRKDDNRDNRYKSLSMTYTLQSLLIFGIFLTVVSMLSNSEPDSGKWGFLWGFITGMIYNYWRSIILAFRIEEGQIAS